MDVPSQLHVNFLFFVEAVSKSGSYNSVSLMELKVRTKLVCEQDFVWQKRKQKGNVHNMIVASFWIL